MLKRWNVSKCQFACPFEPLMLLVVSCSGNVYSKIWLFHSRLFHDLRYEQIKNRLSKREGPLATTGWYLIWLYFIKVIFWLATLVLVVRRMMYTPLGSVAAPKLKVWVWPASIVPLNRRLMALPCASYTSRVAFPVSDGVTFILVTVLNGFG